MSNETEKKEPFGAQPQEEAAQAETAENQPQQEASNQEPVQAQEQSDKKTEEKKETRPKKEKKDTAAEKQEKLQKELAETKDRLLRTVAEYDNFRKRTAKEKDAAFSNGVSHAMTGLLPVLDALEMAVAAPTEDENYKKGVVMTLDKAAQAFQNLHVEEIDAQDKPFDPNTMNAVMQEEADEAHPAGTVTKVFQKGYTLGGHIIRHATVVVAK